jgi:hypothetical protein
MPVSSRLRDVAVRALALGVLEHESASGSEQPMLQTCITLLSDY